MFVIPFSYSCHANKRKLNMYKIDYKIPQNLNRFVNCIIVDESDSPGSKSEIPIYADSYPGIMFQQSDNGFCRQPGNKKLSELFLYGQTITFFTLITEGRFNFVVVQLRHVDINSYHDSLSAAKTIKEKVEIIYRLIAELIESNRVPEEDLVQRCTYRFEKCGAFIRLG